MARNRILATTQLVAPLMPYDQRSDRFAPDDFTLSPLGIERPHIRNGQAIANLNTLIYLLINLRVLQRIRQRCAAPD